MNRRRSDDESRLVWSSDPDGTAPHHPSADGRAPTRRAGDGPVTVARESKGRRGKTVTVIRGVPLCAEGLDDLARDLKQRCGTGGTVRGNVVEIQGDQREAVVAELAKRGWTVKRTGG